ncbi:hypothetical protein L6164_027139 [Bauhinia variegata]|uniref:Uncharacterized protein n=1 Tax=Bauhinia variegata TaxID=167791 RepID=A0ACB9LS82_BAUVA|nr:hypothetical protein L6164_027139 [Bauhinia variegata]
MPKVIVSLPAFLLWSCLVATLHGNELETEEFWKVESKSFDSYWQQRAKEAEVANSKAAVADPFEVTANFSTNINTVLSQSENKTTNGRMLLRGHKDKNCPCEAYNPIDKCWRCDPNWEQNRQRLADCAQGFGRKTTGGKGGKIYVVTDSSDNDMLNPKPGTLRHAVIQNEPLWIVFARSMVIYLKQELIMNSHKTIDGRGANVHIAGGAGITIQYIKNVIIHGIHLHDIVPKEGGMIRDSVNHFGFRTRSDGDAISIFGSNNVWIDHCSLSKATDGLIDSIMGSTAITISNNQFAKHDEVMLFGANDNHDVDAKMQITVAFNNFGKGLIQRMPRCRWGFFHVVNNYYTHWLKYAIGGSMHPTIISEGNKFIAPDDRFLKEVTMRVLTPKSEWEKWQWRSIGDEFLNGAFFVQSGPEIVKEKSQYAQDMIMANPVKFVDQLTQHAGTLSCKVGQPC